jgi:hypothetical protein
LNPSAKLWGLPVDFAVNPAAWARKRRENSVVEGELSQLEDFDETGRDGSEY